MRSFGASLQLPASFCEVLTVALLFIQSSYSPVALFLILTMIWPEEALESGVAESRAVKFWAVPAARELDHWFSQCQFALGE